MMVCDHTSVGIIVRKGENILLLERRKPPFGFALPAGHVDGDNTFEEAAIRELREETGLTAVSMKLLAEERKDNPCRREGGSWHFWKIYEAQVDGEENRSIDETKQMGWFSIAQINDLVARTDQYLNGSIPENEWQRAPGMEPVMRDWLKLI